jgi:hypothetical protein
MIQLAKDAWQKTVIHKMTVIWLVIFTSGSLGTSILTALAGTDWGTIGSQEKLMIYIAIFVNWTNVIAAFINQAISRVKQGEDIVPTATK